LFGFRKFWFSRIWNRPLHSKNRQPINSVLVFYFCFRFSTEETELRGVTVSAPPACPACSATRPCYRCAAAGPQLPARVARACSRLATAPRGSLLAASREELRPAPRSCWSCWVRVRVRVRMGMEDGNGGWSGMRMGVGLLGRVGLWPGRLMRCSLRDARERYGGFGFNCSSVQVEHKIETEVEH